MAAREEKISGEPLPRARTVIAAMAAALGGMLSDVLSIRISYSQLTSTTEAVSPVTSELHLCQGCLVCKMYAAKRETAAAIFIQKYVRMCLPRHVYMKLNSSVVIIQSNVRGFTSRRRFLHIKEHKAATSIQAHWRLCKVRSTFQKCQGSIVAIQCLWQCRQAKCELRRLKQEANEAGALRLAKSKLEKQLEELTWRLQLEKKKRASSEEAKQVEISKLQKMLEGLHLELDTAKLATINESNKNAVLQNQLQLSVKEKFALERELVVMDEVQKENALLKVTLQLLKLLRVVLSTPANRSYFLAQNLLPPVIPMLSAALENYIKIAASLGIPSNSSLPSNKATVENFESISEILNNFLWTATAIFGHIISEERQLQMRDGLLELLISYQVIHRLRDLFALHDRPQMEGSAFPAPILLSIHLLVVLTSRPGTMSYIDWESSPVVMEQEIGSEGTKFADPAHSVVNNSWGDHSPLSVINGSSIMHLPDVPEDRPLDEIPQVNRSDEPTTIRNDSELEHNNSVKLKNDDITKVDELDESKKNRSGDIASSSVPQKDEKQAGVIVTAPKNEKVSTLAQPLAFLLSAVSETGLVSLPSLLTAVLLQANNRTSSEQASFILPSNFEEVATGVLKVLNNVALLDLVFLQRMLARPDLKMEIFHLMSFLLSHCASRWKAPNDQVGSLMLESLSLLGHFALFHPGNQAVLRWGKSPTILHKVCDLPFVFFSDPELMPILAGTLVAACYGCEQNKFVVQQELSVDMLLSLLRSCRNASLACQLNSALDTSTADDSTECNQLGTESRKPQADNPIKHSRSNGKGTRSSLVKSGALGNSTKTGRTRSLRDGKATKSSEEAASKHTLCAPETSPIMLHCRFPHSFIDKVEQFFSMETAGGVDQV